MASPAGYYSGGNLALPDHAAFLMENVHFDGRISLEANHHCNEGVTGVLCRSRCRHHCGHDVRLLPMHTHTHTQTHTHNSNALVAQIVSSTGRGVFDLCKQKTD